MNNDLPKPTRHPLLETILAHRGLPLKGMYTLADAASIFNVSRRAIQHRVKKGELKSRRLPGRAKFLPVDLEIFLAESAA